MNNIIKFTAAVCAAFSLSAANAALVLSTDYESGFNVGAGVSGTIVNGGGSEQSSQGFGTVNFFAMLHSAPHLLIYPDWVPHMLV